jgi:hypothetical protein
MRDNDSKKVIAVLGAKFPYKENENLGKIIGIKRFQKGVDLFKSLNGDALIFAGSIELVHPITKKPYALKEKELAISQNIPSDKIFIDNTKTSEDQNSKYDLTTKGDIQLIFDIASKLYSLSTTKVNIYIITEKPHFILRVNYLLRIYFRKYSKTVNIIFIESTKPRFKD